MKKLRVEISIPVYNEEEELEQNIKRIITFCESKLFSYLWHITIADNASTDNTPIIGSMLAKKYRNISLFRLEQKGRGRAVKQAWSRTDADFYFYMDLDLSTDLVHLPALLTALQKGYDIAIGSRLLKGAKVEGRTILREITSRALNLVFIRLLFKTHFTDAQCGFKAVTKKVVEELIPHIKENDWFFDGELLIVGEKSGHRIYEEPVHWLDNPGSTVRLVSTIWGDMRTMLRLFRERPWEKL
ncbi:MAG: glycosyltransferase [Candidatus Levybacteria bacterium]|nr:glycosyltransferase [Candidatus Levybacteria bacterium]